MLGRVDLWRSGMLATVVGTGCWSGEKEDGSDCIGRVSAV